MADNWSQPGRARRKRASLFSWKRLAGKWCGKPSRTLGVCNAVCFSPEGQFLATSGEEKQVNVWELASGKQVAKLKDHVLSDFGIVGVAWSSDGQWLACTNVRGHREPGQVTVYEVTQPVSRGGPQSR
jgi:WD40 repeat protein